MQRTRALNRDAWRKHRSGFQNRSGEGSAESSSGAGFQLIFGGIKFVL
jgi:hypothetical protein